MDVNVPNLVADLILTGIVLYLTSQWRDSLERIIASRDAKISLLEERNEDLQMEYINALKKIKGVGEVDTQVKRGSRTLAPGLTEDERLAAIKRMNEE